MIRSLPTYWFNVTGKTQRPAMTLDSGGGQIWTYADNVTSLAMRINTPSGGQLGTQNRIDGMLVLKIFLPGGTDIVARDRIIYNARTFDVKAIRNPDEFSAFLTIDAVEVLSTAVVV